MRRRPGASLLTGAGAETDSECLTRHSEEWIPASAGMTERAGAKIPRAIDIERSELERGGSPGLCSARGR